MEVKACARFSQGEGRPTLGMEVSDQQELDPSESGCGKTLPPAPDLGHLRKLCRLACAEPLAPDSAELQAG